MPRKSLSLPDYNRIASEHNMQFVGPLPNRATVPTHWNCLVCGRKHFKSANSITHHSPCVCRTQMTLKATDYESLATRLGITWSGQYPPHNKVKIEWFGTHGESFYASYNEIGYSFISNRLRRYIYG